MEPLKHYINTNNLPPIPEAEANKKAVRQENIVLHIFKHKGAKLTAYDIENIWRKNANKLNAKPPLITSIRRAISLLKKMGILEKTEDMTEGRYGLPVHYYTLNPAHAIKEKQLKLEF